MGYKIDDEIEQEVSPSGTIRTIYSDNVPDLAKSLGAQIVSIDRASMVEWEQIEGKAGWTVRANHDRALALRMSESGDIVVSRDGDLVFFDQRQSALDMEKKLFWKLLPEGE